MDGGCAGFNEMLDQLEGIQRSAKAGFRVGEDGRQPVDAVLTLHVADLVGPQQGIIDPPYQIRCAIHRV